MKATNHHTITTLGKIQCFLTGTIGAVLIASLFAVAARAGDEPKGAAKLAPKKVETKKEAKIQITGSLIPQKVKRAGFITDTSFPVAIIDRAEIERTGGATLTQVLRRHPAGR